MSTPLPIHNHGSLAVELNAKVRQLNRALDHRRKEKLLIELVDFMSLESTRNVVRGLSIDPKAIGRTLAASTINYLWLYWKFIPYDGNKKDYAKQCIQYCKSLQWTLPVAELLIHDRAIWPAELTIYTTREMEHAPMAVRKKFRRHVQQMMSHVSPEIRRAAVCSITDLYDYADDGRQVDEETLRLLIQATYDIDESVREWACFTLRVGVEGQTNDIKKALQDAYNREKPDSGVYKEAAIGLAEYEHTPTKKG